MVKAKLRSCMKQDRLDDMLMIFIEQKLASQINPADVFDKFKNLHPFERRLELYYY